uniref:Uncharacterized protein n=1 Tax=Phakopsora pachyrhizi TaxID=170000 RepID=A0A0S1MKP8_PHAPC
MGFVVPVIRITLLLPHSLVMQSQSQTCCLTQAPMHLPQKIRYL